jgi:hypothetical protein
MDINKIEDVDFMINLLKENTLETLNEEQKKFVDDPVLKKKKYTIPITFLNIAKVCMGTDDSDIRIQFLEKHRKTLIKAAKLNKTL